MIEWMLCVGSTMEWKLESVNNGISFPTSESFSNRAFVCLLAGSNVIYPHVIHLSPHTLGGKANLHKRSDHEIGFTYNFWPLKLAPTRHNKSTHKNKYAEEKNVQNRN